MTSDQPRPTKDRGWLYGVIGLAIGAVVVLCLIAILGFVAIQRLMPGFPAAPQLTVGAPLGSGEALAFAYVKAALRNPYELYLLDDLNGAHALNDIGLRQAADIIWSPDGIHLAGIERRGLEAQLYRVINTETLAQIELEIDGEVPRAAHWSPDGQRLAYLVDRYGAEDAPNEVVLTIADITTGAAQHATLIAGEIVQDIAWAPARDAIIAVVSSDMQTEIRCYDLNSEQWETLSQAPHLHGAWNLVIAPDGAHIAYLKSQESDPDKLPTDTLAVAGIDGAPPQRISDFSVLAGIGAWSPDSARIAITTLDAEEFGHRLHVVDVKTSTVREVMRYDLNVRFGFLDSTALTWSPDGARIAAAGYDEDSGPIILVINADGSGHHQVVSAPHGIFTNLDWRPHPAP